MTEWIVSSIVLIVVVSLVRQLLKGKISLRLQYALWALVLIRLLVPISFGQSKLSVQNVVAEHEPAQIVDSYTPPEEDPVVSEVIQPAQPSEPSSAVDPGSAEVVKPSAEPEQPTAEAPDVSVTDVLCVVWYVGIAGVALWFAVSNLNFWLRLRRSRTKLEAASRLPVYVTGAVETPCLFGLIRPAIYLTPEVATDPTAMTHVLAHEQTHYRHWDHIWSVLRCVCLALHWYNPLVWLAAALSRRDCELSCDEGTIRRIGEDERTAYGRTLIGLTCAHRGNLLHTATTMTGSKKSIKERIMLIAKKPKMAVYTLVAVILIAAIAVGCTFTGAVKSGEENVDSLFAAQTVTKHWEIVKSVEVENLTYADAHDIVGAVLYRDLKTDTAGIAFVEEDGYYSLGLSAQVYADSALVYEGAGTVLFYLQTEDGEPYECRVTLSFSETGVIQLHSESEFAEPPAFVQATAEFQMELRRAHVEQEYLMIGMTHEVLAELKGLTRLELGTAGLDWAVEMWKMDYDITVAAGQEANTTADTLWLVVLYDYTTEKYTRFLGSMDEKTLNSTYNIPELIDKYGDMYRAAAMELYGQYGEEASKLNAPVSPSDGLYNLTKRGNTVSLTLHTKEGGAQRTFFLDYQSDAWRTTNLRTGVSWNLLSEAPEGDWDYWLTYLSADGTASITFYAGKNGPVCYKDEQRTVWWTERGGTPDAETLREEVYDACLAEQVGTDMP